MVSDPRRDLVRLALFTDTEALALVRDRIRTTLPELTEDVRTDVLLVATELVTNAFLHGQPPVQFQLLGRLDGTPLRIEVTDHGPALPQLREPDALAPNGRGLLLVAASTSSWGVETGRHSKTVWAEFA